MNYQEKTDIVKSVLEELADSLPEVMDTDLWRENMPVTIPDWNKWNELTEFDFYEGSNYKTVNHWFREQLENYGIGSSIETLGGGAEGVTIYGETLHALFTTDHGLGIYVNGDDMPSPDVPVFMFPMDSSTRLMFSTPVDYAEAMAKLLAVTLFANENFGGK